MKISTSALITAATYIAATPAIAQDIDTSATFDGPYVSGVVGISAQPNDRNETLVFDTTGNGSFDNTVSTVTGADAFSPGFCGGAANGNRPGQGCRSDKDGIEYFGRVGLDKRMGNFVVGALVEGGRTELRDSVTGFSTTPASYTVNREVDYTINARLRAGYTPNGGILFYATGGGAYAKLDNSFDTTNGANSFTNNGRTNAWGYQVGGGAEAMVLGNLSIGLEYLYTSLSDDDFVVTVGPGTAGPTNPFLIQNGQTDLRRSNSDLNTHSLRLTTSLRF
ncbi:outer membrane protein [Pontixanthobacter sp.]|uniref:outer membrane protein n=1 Tax=Pontixanthobacter sp. TaxID=2792078 RepID=UPI003C7C743D